MQVSVAFKDLNQQYHIVRGNFDAEHLNVPIWDLIGDAGKQVKGTSVLKVVSFNVAIMEEGEDDE